MKSSEGGQETSIVVRSCREGKDSYGPRSTLDWAEWERTICAGEGKRG